MANLEKEDVHHVRTSKINEYKNSFQMLPYGRLNLFIKTVTLF